MRLNVELRSDIYEEVAAHAEREGRSLSDVVRTLLFEWCKRKRREDLARLHEYQEGNGGDVVLELMRREGGAKED